VQGWVYNERATRNARSAREKQLGLPTYDPSDTAHDDGVTRQTSTELNDDRGSRLGDLEGLVRCLSVLNGVSGPLQGFEKVHNYIPGRWHQY
jgi:hypothetical protein